MIDLVFVVDPTFMVNPTMNSISGTHNKCEIKEHHVTIF